MPNPLPTDTKTQCSETGQDPTSTLADSDENDASVRSTTKTYITMGNHPPAVVARASFSAALGKEVTGELIPVDFRKLPTGEKLKIINMYKKTIENIEATI
jgi:hypothetical protein